MNIGDKFRKITDVRATGPSSVHLVWSDGTTVELDLGSVIIHRAFSALRDPDRFAQVKVGEWGGCLDWSSDVEMGADMLWRETLSAIGHDDTRAFLDWRLRNGLSLSKAADALGISRRMTAYYSNGEKRVPRPIQLACRGWEVSEGVERAA